MTRIRNLQTEPGQYVLAMTAFISVVILAALIPVVHGPWRAVVIGLMVALCAAGGMALGMVIASVNNRRAGISPAAEASSTGGAASGAGMGGAGGSTGTAPGPAEWLPSRDGAPQ